MMRMDRQISVTDQVQFLVLTELEPGAREIKRRAFQGGQFQRITIECDTGVDIGNMQGNVIELSNDHGILTALERTAAGGSSLCRMVIPASSQHIIDAVVQLHGETR